ncbi:unnamed protein product, partial [marine sediment metagenome]
EEKELPDRILGRMSVIYAIVAAALVLPNVVVPVSVPDAYSVLGGDARPGAVMELPASTSFYQNSRWLFFQSVHGRPIISGPALPDVAASFDEDVVLKNALARALLAPVERPAASPEAADLPRLAANLASNGVRFAVVHRDFPGGASADRLARLAFGEPVFRGQGADLFEIRAGTQPQ